MPKIYPDAHILESMQAQPLAWWKRLAELIDNALDARASRVSISFKNRTLSVVDDGIGVRNPLAVVTLGKHDKHASTGLGRYGIGAKDAWLCTGPVIEIISVHGAVRRKLRVDVRDLAKNDWEVPEPTELPAEEASYTEIRISIKQTAPLWKDICDRLGWVFAPALLSGKQIVFLDTAMPTPLSPARLPPLLNAVADTFAIDGKHVEINIGMLPHGVRNKFGQFWIQYGHRLIADSTIGTKGRCIGKMAGLIVLGEGWKLAKNKDELIDDQDALADAIFSRIEPLLSECEATTEQVETDVLKTELEGLLNAALKDTKQEKRSRTNESKGTCQPAATGRKRTNAAKVSDNPGSVVCRQRRGFSIAFVEEDESRFGHFDAIAKTVILNMCHPVIAMAKKCDNRHAMLSAASVILANYDATTDGGQKLLGCAVGDFQEAYVRLITSLVKAEAQPDAN